MSTIAAYSLVHLVHTAITNLHSYEPCKKGLSSRQGAALGVQKHGERTQCLNVQRVLEDEDEDEDKDKDKDEDKTVTIR